MPGGAAILPVWKTDEINTVLIKINESLIYTIYIYTRIYVCTAIYLRGINAHRDRGRVVSAERLGWGGEAEGTRMVSRLRSGERR